MSSKQSPAYGTFFLNKFILLFLINIRHILVELTQKIQSLIEPIIGSKDAYLVEIGIRGSQSGKTIEIFIDNSTGVTTELCAEISREISLVLDAANIFQYKYHLVVSSPGIDRPLKYPQQYPKNIGRKFIIKLRNEQGVTKVQGILIGATQNEINLRLENGAEQMILFDQVIDARVVAAL